VLELKGNDRQVAIRPRVHRAPGEGVGGRWVEFFIPPADVDKGTGQWTLIDIGQQIDLLQVCFLAPFNKGLTAYGESIAVGMTCLHLK